MTFPQPSDSERLERIERLLEGLVTDMAVMKKDVAGLQSDMSIVKEDVSGLQRDMSVVKEDVSGLQRDMSVVKEDVARLKSDVGVLQRDTAVMKGWQTELAVERRARSVFRRLCRGHLLRIYPGDELHHYTSERTNAGTMSRDDADRAESVDFLMEGTGSDGAPVMYAVEASYTCGIGDSDRAIDRAALLTTLLAREVRPAVVGEVFITGFEADAAARNVAYARVSNGNEIVR